MAACASAEEGNPEEDHRNVLAQEDASSAAACSVAASFRRVADRDRAEASCAECEEEDAAAAAAARPWVAAQQSLA